MTGAGWVLTEQQAVLLDYLNRAGYAGPRHMAFALYRRPAHGGRAMLILRRLGARGLVVRCGPDHPEAWTLTDEGREEAERRRGAHQLPGQGGR